MIPTREQARAAMTAAFERRLAGSPHKITTNWEIEGEALAFYIKPSNLEQRCAVREAFETKEADGIIEQIISRALREDGTPQFISLDAEWMKTLVDPNDLSRVALEIIKYDKRKGVDATVKKSEGTANS